MADTKNPVPSLLLFSDDRHLAQTRHWLLEQARFQITTVYSLDDLEAAGVSITLFLLCNSLSAEIRDKAIDRIRLQWPDAKILAFVPTYPLPELAVDKFFSGMEGPDKLIQTIRSLVLNDRPSIN